MLTVSSNSLTITSGVNKNRLEWIRKGLNQPIVFTLLESSRNWIDKKDQAIDKVEETGIVMWDFVFSSTEKISSEWNRGLVNWPIECESTLRFKKFLDKKVFSKIKEEK